ncbi:MAG: DUF2156 domain-containing protein [Corynebacterium sp.]|nr:DUF2156 domain-containing protein [Corynebacterium sp.]
MTTEDQTHGSRLSQLSLGLYHRAATTWFSIANIYRKAPASMCTITIMWFLYWTFRNDMKALRHFFAIDLAQPGDYWHLFSSGLTANSLSACVLSTVLLATIGVLTERAIGTTRFVGAAVIFQLIGTLIGIGAVNIAGAFSNVWEAQLRHQPLLSPTGWLFGVTAAGTAAMPILWRRRVRVFILAIAITLFLYSGSITDFPRLCATILGLLIGQWAVIRNAKRGRISRRESRVLVATAVFAVTVGPFVGSLNHSAAGPLSRLAEMVWTPKDFARMHQALCAIDSHGPLCDHGPVALVVYHVVWGVSSQLFPLCMLVISWGLVRGRRLAWVLALGASVAALGLIIYSFVNDPEVNADNFRLVGLVGVCLPWLAVIILLIWRYWLFDVRLPRALLLRKFLVLAGWFAFCSLIWAALGVPAHLGAGHWLASFLPPVLGANIYSEQMQYSHLAWAAYLWPSLIFWLGTAVILYVAVTINPRLCEREQQERARQMLMKGTGDHLAWMTLWEDNSYWFDPEGRGYVAYRIHNGVAVTVGAPVISALPQLQDLAPIPDNLLTEEDLEKLPEEAAIKKNAALRERALAEREEKLAAAHSERLEALARGFEELCQQQGWHVAWYSINREFSKALESRGWKSLQVAEESMVPVATKEDIAFKGKKFQDVRTAKNRAGKEGIHSEWTTWAEASSIVRERIVALSEDWVADKSLPEMGFTLGGIDELKAPEVKLMLALDDNDHVHGVTSWLPVYEDGEAVGLILDFMRRDAEGFKPVVEYLIAEAIEKAHAEGYQWVSLSGAPLAHTSTNEEDDSILTTVLDKVGAALEPLYGFRSLAFFKAKFQPRHEPWVLCYMDELALPSIGMAISKSYVPNMSPGQFVHVARQLANR